MMEPYDLVDGRVVTPQGLELNVAYHCNLSCASCSHLSPIFTRSLADPGAVERDIHRLAASFRASFVKVLGGEPLLHPELGTILRAVRESGIAPRIQVCSNGALLPRMKDDFWEAVDEVEVSVYPGKELSEDRLARIQRSADRAGTILKLEYFSHFRCSYSEIGTDDRDLVRQIFRTCQIAHVWRCHTLFEGHFFKCPQAVFLPRSIGRPEDPWADALEIGDGPDFARRLQAYLRAEEPLETCRNCMGSVGRQVAHHQVRRTEFRDLQQEPTEDLLDRRFLAVLQDHPEADDGCCRAQ